MRVPRIMLAGVSSGSGKTTVSCAVMQALVNRGLALHAFKCGPDYIDPLFHQRAIGAKGSNLDMFFYDEKTLLSLLARHGKQADVSIMEGVMGYYDGLSFNNDTYSSHHIAKLTQTPAILVVNARGMAYSLIALLKGFVDAIPGSGICGVILNQISALSYARLKNAIEEHFDDRLQVFGHLPPMPDAVFQSRHLGLVTPDAMGDIQQKLQALAKQAEATIDLNGIIQLAQSALEISGEEDIPLPSMASIRLAIAQDAAFCFYYQDNLDMLRALGAQLLPFSPLQDPQLPDCDALYIGGGYPELYLDTLTANHAMLQSIRSALQKGMPCIAECGGFMYLTQAIDEAPMVGFLPGTCSNMGKLVRFGYATLTAQKDNLLCKQSQHIPVHEFHYYDCTDNGDGFMVEKPSGKSWACVRSTNRLYAGFPHLPLYANPEFAISFYQQALQYQQEKEQ